MRPTLLLLAFLLPLCAEAQPATPLPDAPPLAIVTEADSAYALGTAGESKPLAALAAVRTYDRLATSADGALALYFADGLRVRWGGGTTAMVTGQYVDVQYVDRGLALDSGFVAYRFEADSTDSAFRLGAAGEAAVALVQAGSGAVLSDASGLRLVVLEGEGLLFDPSSDERLRIPAGMVGVADAEGLRFRPSTLAERDQVAEPAERRRRLLVPGTDDEGNARTFIIEWNE